MPLYVTLGTYTAEAMQHISEVPQHFQRNRSLIESGGGKLIGVYALMGEWDLLVITEFPDEKRALSALLTICKTGRMTTQTMTALPFEEFATLASNA